MLAWTVMDRNGGLLPRFIAGSPREVARKVVRNRYDDRHLQSALGGEDWRIAPLKYRVRGRRRSTEQLELKLN